MDDASIYERLNRLFRHVLGDDDLVVTAETTADDVPEWDSMNHIFLVVEIERSFGIKFRPAEMEDLHDVGELVSLIQAKLSRAPA